MSALLDHLRAVQNAQRTLQEADWTPAQLRAMPDSLLLTQAEAIRHERQEIEDAISAAPDTSA